MKQLLLISLIILSFFKSSAQEIDKKSKEEVKKSFKLIFDNIPVTNQLTPQQLKGVKKIHTAVAGEKIKSFLVVFTGAGFTDNPGYVECKGDKVSGKLKKLISKVVNGTTVHFDDITLLDKDGNEKHGSGVFSIKIIE